MTVMTQYPVDHLLDLLAPTEIDAAREIPEDAEHISDGTRYIDITLNESDKADVRAYQTDGEVIKQKIKIVARNKHAAESYEEVNPPRDDVVTQTRAVPLLQGEPRHRRSARA